MTTAEVREFALLKAARHALEVLEEETSSNDGRVPGGSCPACSLLPPYNHPLCASCELKEAIYRYDRKA